MRRPPRTPPKDRKKHRINEEIRAKEVQVIGPDGKALGVMPLRQALELAWEQDMDLVEVAPNANPPVCKIMDYGKFLYEERKKRKASKGKPAEVKEITLRPNIGEHDLQVKLNKAREFLEGGNKVRFQLRFRGREIVHSEDGKALLLRIAQELEDLAQIESGPFMTSRIMIMLLKPRKK